MLMEAGHAGFQELVGKALMIFGAFWVIVLLVLYFGIGILSNKEEKLLKKDH